MALNSLERLQGEMKEKLAWDQKQKIRAVEAEQRNHFRGVYQQLKDEYPGQPIYACTALLRCPWYACGYHHLITAFMTIPMGTSFHLICPKCQCNFITLRDTVRVFGNNTYPVLAVQRLMRKHDGAYGERLNKLRAAYAHLYQVQNQLLAEKRKAGRTHELTFGDGKKAPIKLSVTGQTIDEAREEMKVTRNPTGVGSHPLANMDTEAMEEFENDPQSQKRWK